MSGEIASALRIILYTRRAEGTLRLFYAYHVPCKR